MNRFLLPVATLALLLLANGCGKSNPSTAEVSGKVLLGEKLLHSGTITFVDSQKKERSTGISPDGSYRVNRLAVGPARITLVTHSSTPFITKELPGPPRTTAYEVRRGEQEHDLVFDP
jgi:hypothetical protein